MYTHEYYMSNCERVLYIHKQMAKTKINKKALENSLPSLNKWLNDP